MTAQRIALVCWIWFVIMCVAFLGVGAGIEQLTAIPAVPRSILAAVGTIGLWWGPWIYAMYLSWAVRYGDPRLLGRGIHAKAVVMAAKETNEQVSMGEADWMAPWVYKYHLKVAVPGKEPYETDCSLCYSGIDVGQTVNVAVSPHNKKRVAIDIGSNERLKWWRKNKRKKDVQGERRQQAKVDAAIRAMEASVQQPEPPADR